MNKMTNIIFSILIGLSLLMSSLVSHALPRSSDIKDWAPHKVEKGFILSNELYYKKFCSKLYTKQIPEFLLKNPQVKNPDKFYPGDQITIQNCQYIKENPPITSWSKIRVEKGFVLYHYLTRYSGCFNNNKAYIWDYHVVEFKTHNPDVKDINLIAIGDTVEVQRCDWAEEKIIAPVALLTEESKDPVQEQGISESTEGVNSSSEISQESTAEKTEVSAESDQVEGIREESIPRAEGAKSFTDVSDAPADDTMLFVSVGFLSEGNNRTDLAAGARYKTSVYPQVEYQARLDGAAPAIYFNHQINFISVPKESLNQYFVGIGLGQRYGIKDELTMEDRNRSIEMYPYASLGYRKVSKKAYVEGQIGSNVTGQTTPNISVLGMKRLGQSEYMLGLYADWRNSKSPINSEKEPLKYFTGGVIFSY